MANYIIVNDRERDEETDELLYWSNIDVIVRDNFPQTEETAKTCVHNVKVWFGHECGDCEDSPDGYKFA